MLWPALAFIVIGALLTGTVLLLFPACQRQECPVAPVPELVTHTLYASTPGEEEPQTRTIVSVSDDKKILWSARRR